MRRRSFLLGALSTGTVILTHRSSHAAGLETWRSYNTGRFEQVRDSLSSSNQRWIDVDLRRMKVTALLGSQILIHQNQQLSFQCDDGDVYNPTITGHFSPDSSAESVSMSGRKQLSTGYKEYKDIVTHYVIFFCRRIRTARIRCQLSNQWFPCFCGVYSPQLPECSSPL